MPFTENQIDELEAFFKKAKMPSTVQLDEGSKNTSGRTFIQSYLNVVRANTDKPITEVFYARLVRLRELVS